MKTQTANIKLSVIVWNEWFDSFHIMFQHSKPTLLMMTPNTIDIFVLNYKAPIFDLFLRYVFSLLVALTFL